jgi:hypothetical protein
VNGDGDRLPPSWWLWIRRVVIFALGVSVIGDALIADKVNIWELVIGLILVGVLPLDDVAHYLQRVPPRVPRHHSDDSGDTP